VTPRSLFLFSGLFFFDVSSVEQLRQAKTENLSFDAVQYKEIRPFLRTFPNLKPIFVDVITGNLRERHAQWLAAGNGVKE
jgi:hypothetical protein